MSRSVSLISEYETSFTTRPWLFWWPGSFIVIIALTINFIGDGLRDAFDPRQRRALNRAARQQRLTGSPEAGRPRAKQPSDRHAPSTSRIDDEPTTVNTTSAREHDQP